ncbi:MAG TPA: cytochrome P460 family protein [Ramlibacter sp.]|nr:cytochrome P460 family protein [Ramlibacter sp.]
MGMTRGRVLLAVLIASVGSLAGWQASAENNRVTFPKNLDQLVHYTTVKRGNSTERMLISQFAIEAAKNGRELPAGTQVVLADFRDGQVFRYFVMEKGQGWGADYAPGRRTGDWQFQSFKPDRTVNLSENTARCQSCHQGQKETQFLYTFNDLRRFNGTPGGAE